MYSGGELTLETVLYTLAFLSLLNRPLTGLPFALSNAVEAIISLRRFDAYLAAPELPSMAASSSGGTGRERERKHEHDCGGPVCDKKEPENTPSRASVKVEGVSVMGVREGVAAVELEHASFSYSLPSHVSGVSGADGNANGDNSDRGASVGSSGNGNSSNRENPQQVSPQPTQLPLQQPPQPPPPPPSIPSQQAQKQEQVHESERGHCVLRDVSVSIPQGELIAVIGPVGAGKTSLLLAFLQELYQLSGKQRLNSDTEFAYAVSLSLYIFFNSLCVIARNKNSNTHMHSIFTHTHTHAPGTQVKCPGL